MESIYFRPHALLYTAGFMKTPIIAHRNSAQQMFLLRMSLAVTHVSAIDTSQGCQPLPNFSIL